LTCGIELEQACRVAMPVDNTIYETLDDWWDPTGSVAGIHAMNPARASYFCSALRTVLGTDWTTRPILDVGCGGGLLTEELARAGARVTGIDLAGRALRIARDHAGLQNLTPSYVRAAAERIPFPDETFAAVLSSDFLEHVTDLALVVRECARVLAPGGVFLFDTINRTWFTSLFHINLLQEWRAIVPANTHDWHRFIKPTELAALMRAAGLEPVQTRGLFPVHPIRFGLHLLRHRFGKDRMPPFRVCSVTAGSYLGYGVKGAARRFP
jgi:2-polyprenyl-6-hydroxyphenyl methylase / 3-demethylubiquinone-9 3-methyltransferase